jgi:hypothetical protein
MKSNEDLRVEIYHFYFYLSLACYIKTKIKNFSTKFCKPDTTQSLIKWAQKHAIIEVKYLCF